MGGEAREKSGLTALAPDFVRSSERIGGGRIAAANELEEK